MGFPPPQFTSVRSFSSTPSFRCLDPMTGNIRSCSPSVSEGTRLGLIFAARRVAFAATSGFASMASIAITRGNTRVRAVPQNQLGWRHRHKLPNFSRTTAAASQARRPSTNSAPPLHNTGILWRGKTSITYAILGDAAATRLLANPRSSRNGIGLATAAPGRSLMAATPRFPGCRSVRPPRKGTSITPFR